MTRSHPVTTASTEARINSGPVRMQWLLPVLLVVLYLAQCTWFIRTQSLTYDEPVHIAEGMDAWRDGRFEQYNDHPPLARLWCALPLLDHKWQVDIEKLPESFRVSRITPDPISLAWRARAMNVLLGFLLAWLVWRVAERLFSRVAANFALALFVFSPSMVAHFSIATTDGAATLLIFATTWTLACWRRDPGWKNTVGLALLSGLMLLAKFSTAPMFVLVLLWMIALVSIKQSPHRIRLGLQKTATFLVLTFLIVWAGYFFHVSRLTVRDGTLTATFPNWSAPIVKPAHGRNYSVLVPAGEYVEGFRELVRHNRQGQPAFFLGQASSHGGWKLYYPIVILLKWPTTVLVLALIGLALAARRIARQIPVPRDLWIMASFPALYLAMAIFAHFNLGERHVLPLYPFAIMFAAAVWEGGAIRGFAKLLLIGLALMNAADAMRFAPGYLSYFTPFVRPADSYLLLSDSNLDWGQGLLALKAYQDEHPDERIALSYFGSVDPKEYGIQASAFDGNKNISGTVVVSATNLSGQYLSDPEKYRWLLQLKPVAILDHSLYIFKVGGNQQ
jgi:4-amino-4-deoxy-L-arabinose transferase-like glycosyltransferase